MTPKYDSDIKMLSDICSVTVTHVGEFFTELPCNKCVTTVNIHSELTGTWLFK